MDEETLLYVKRPSTEGKWEQCSLATLRAKIASGEIERESRVCADDGEMTADAFCERYPVPAVGMGADAVGQSLQLQPAESTPGSGMTAERLLASVVALGENTADKGSGTGILIATGLLFLGLGGLKWGWSMVVFLAVAVALHELGHVLAMRFFGYKNVRMLFVPMFGALAMGEPRELDATRNALIALAGPAFGLFIALQAGLLAICFGHPVWLDSFCLVSLILNLFNLLPLMPLDGGQFLNEALFARHPFLELVFRVIAIAGFAWLALKYDLWVLGLLACFVYAMTRHAFRRARIIAAARKDPAWQTRTLDLDTVRLLREMVTRIFAAVAPRIYERKMPIHVLKLWLEVRKRFPGPGRSVALLLGYLLLIAIALPSGYRVMRQFSRSSIEQALTKAAGDQNKNLPKMFGNGTRLDSIVASPDEELIYHFTLVNREKIEWNQDKLDAFSRDLRAKEISSLKTNSDVQGLLERGVSMRFQIYDKDGVLVNETVIRADDLK